MSIHKHDQRKSIVDHREHHEFSDSIDRLWSALLKEMMITIAIALHEDEKVVECGR